MESRGSPVVAPLPEVLKASTELRAAQGDDGVCALDGPVHASPFEPGADHHFASRLEDAGGGAQTLGVKLRVAHASAIAEDILRTFGRLGEGSGMGLESVDDGVQFAIDRKSTRLNSSHRC